MNSQYDSAAPLFFLSYARTPVYDPQQTYDADHWVRTFYGDLVQSVHEQLSPPSDATPGFIDSNLLVGENWQREISRALAECRVFIALYSPRYFDTEHCGREWAAIEDRLASDRALSRPSSVSLLPVIWAPVHLDRMPAAARRVQMLDAEVSSEQYRKYGVYGLIRLRRWRTEYQELVYRLSRQVVSRASAVSPAPGPVHDYTTLRNAFADDSWNSSVPRLRITVVAPTAENLPPSRDARYYGPRARDWRPFVPQTDRTLADACADVTTSVGFRPYVEDWSSQRPDRWAADEESPGLLLIDPWAVEADPAAADWLADFDRDGHESTAVLVAGGPDDAQSTEAWARLEEGLRERMPHRYGRTGPREHSLARVGSLQDLGRALPTVTSAAAKQFLRRATAHPPKGDAMARPRLTGPAPSSAADGGPQPEGSDG
jgi:FxsC-like protein